ncbi:hypothetical protein QBC37DRAFT_466962 [Rhypophila decipiens]|uniref:Uncharacterized protein n=1 Tax=Rhypophila decipiens TaxID=261697 RepID=A0AAN7B6F8_9PEZI|nr:hypothetical protein QBC37DRAFT_466962 [Rhypophila decipiens]
MESGFKTHELAQNSVGFQPFPSNCWGRLLPRVPTWYSVAGFSQHLNRDPCRFGFFVELGEINDKFHGCQNDPEKTSRGLKIASSVAQLNRVIPLPQVVGEAAGTGYLTPSKSSARLLTLASKAKVGLDRIHLPLGPPSPICDLDRGSSHNKDAGTTTCSKRREGLAGCALSQSFILYDFNALTSNNKYIRTIGNEGIDREGHISFGQLESSDLRQNTTTTATMKLKTVVIAFVMPLLARAEDPETTVTSTKYQTMTKTVTLVKAPTFAANFNSSMSLYPTASSKPVTSLPTSSPTPTGNGVPDPSQTGAASSLGGAHVAVLAMAGAAVAVLL